MNLLEQENTDLRAQLKRLHLELKDQALTEKRYSESQERFRTIFEQSQFGNKIITSELQIIQVNKALQVMLGYSEKELLGSKIIQYVHPEYIQSWRDLQQNLWINNIPSFQIETRLVKKNGTMIWAEITSILFVDNDTTLGYTTLEDISERKALEDQLEKQTALINNDLDNFIYTAFHDLKAPVANIEGLLMALTKKLTGNLLTEEQNQILAMIRFSSDRLKATIADLTEIAKVQKEHVEDEIVVLDELIDEVYQDLSTLVAQTSVNLHRHLGVKEVKFARKHIHCILYTLLLNAIQYRSVERTPEITIQTHLQEEYIVIEVADNGMGIAKKSLPKLFTMFKRFHTHVEGTGIGLYIVKRILEKAGGKIEVESKIDIGTVFNVYLPILRS